MWDTLGIRDFQVFLIAATMLALTPGQDTLYVLGRTLAQGRAAGIASVMGILSGALIHLLAGALGLSALLIASPSAFAVVRCFFVIGTAWLFCIVGFASGIGGKLRHDPRFAKTLNRTAGVLFMVLGLRLVLQR